MSQKIIIICALIFLMLMAGCMSSGIPTTEFSQRTSTPKTALPATLTTTPQSTEISTLIPMETESADTVAIFVPHGIPPIIDGTISPNEWENAIIEYFADNSELLLLQNGGYLYLAFRADPSEMIIGNVFIHRGDEIAILHASAAIGTAKYRQAAEAWQLTKPFEWCCRGYGDRARDQEEQDNFFLQEGWIAVNSRTGNPNELEYKIEIGSEEIKIAVNYLTVSSDPNTPKSPWPVPLDDDVTRPTPDGLPSELFFSPEKWAKIEL
jgi:hypothetical protein